MIGLDTNVLVRYLAQDHPEQSRVAGDLIESLTEESPGFVSLITVIEVDWVLRRRYEVTPSESDPVIRRLLDSAELVIEESDVLRRALARRGRADLADAVVCELGARAGCRHTVTLDRKAARSLDGMVLLGAG